MKLDVNFSSRLSNFALGILVVIVVLITVVEGSKQERLSDGNPPFLRYGKTLSERKDTLREGEFFRYQDAFQKFPTVETCVEQDADGTGLENKKFLWKHMHTKEQVNWCVFLLASELQSVEKLTMWFIRNDLNC